MPRGKRIIMCGIFGYVGTETNIAPMVVAALRTMEYRGYDSWGIGWDDGTALTCVKSPGRVPPDLTCVPHASLALGHTRWATHGGVTAANAHPHLDCTAQVGVVHNGVIENAELLREHLARSHRLQSDTDSEAIAHMIEDEMANGTVFGCAVGRVFLALHGSNAIVACDRRTKEIAAVTSRSPLRLGRSAEGWCLASDPLALTGLSDEVAVIPDNALLRLDQERATLTDLATGRSLPLEWMPVPREQDVLLGNFEHYMGKEIHEQPEVIERLLLQDQEAAWLRDALSRFDHILVTGCGSAYYAGAMGADWLREVCPAWVDVLPASEVHAELRHRHERTLLLALSQSGETADVVDAIYIAKGWGATTAALVNTASSTVARIVDYVVPLHAGVERSVLATKSFLAMVVRMMQLTSSPDVARHNMGRALPLVRSVLDCDVIHEVAGHIAEREDVLVLGKGTGHKLALEAALKLKEGCYVHAEAFLAGELKHGPLALVTDGLPSVLFATSEAEATSCRIAAREIASRGGLTIGIGTFGPSDCAITLPLPERGRAMVLPAIVVAQLVAYGVARRRGIDPDFPRNLAKSVTVR